MKKTIILTVLVAITAICFSATRTITGVVLDDQGQPLPGVTVTIKGTTQGTITDIDGKFTLQVNSEDAELVFSFIGFQNESLKIAALNNITIQMTPKKSALEEVVVVGYGVQKKESVVGAISQVKSPSGNKTVRVRGIPRKLIMQRNIHQSNYYAPQPDLNSNTEGYATIHENEFRKVMDEPQSTFSIDVDKASYANVRRFIQNGQTPPVDAVRIEEMINYFNYDYPQPQNEHPFSINYEYSECPWNRDNKLLHIGLQGKDIPTDNLPPSNLVFLIDVSGSMSSHNKLPLLKQAFKLLVDQIRQEDRVAIVVYAGSSGLVLPSTSGKNKDKILEALDRLQSGGSTAGAAGLKLAYKVAAENFIQQGNNRIILATDGDFNVGQSSNSEMERLITKHRDMGVFISVLGFGMGNYKDDKMEIIADKGNGNYAYIDNLMEAKKVFINEFGGTLFTIAKDVKIQIEFNPTVVKSYRLVGYENRLLNNEDFDDDKKDAGELGAGHTVTALYEIELANNEPGIKKLKYQQSTVNPEANPNEVAYIKFRYKKPDGKKSTLMEETILNKNLSLTQTSDNYRFSAAVAGFGMLLRNSKHKENCNYGMIIDLANKAKGKDKEGYRSEFIRLVELSQTKDLAKK
ncbi:MAG: von Willebrand factor type A domain-containing protein [Bacteroidales bacterium]|nr:von Willebrand factor type A domain-containing protein [Bacteroidales bacterium]